METPPLSPTRPDDGSPWPRISIVTPSYNQGQFIEETIRSVLLQGYPDLEYIIMDGGSTDESVAIIKKYEPWLTYWVSQEDSGQSQAINKGFARCSGQIVAWLNSDDVFCEGALRVVGERFPSTNNFALLAGTSEFRTENGCRTLWSIDTLPCSFADLFRYPDGLFLAQPSVFISMRSLKEVGGLNERLHYAMDLDLWLRLTARQSISVIGDRLSWIRWQGEAKTRKYTFRVLDEVDQVLSANANGTSTRQFRTAKAGLRRRRADAWVQEGLQTYFAGDRNIARSAAFSALREFPMSIFHRAWLSLISRLMLPKPIHKLVFKRS